MIEWYYQIKGKHGHDNYFSNWSFPPIFSGKVTAENKKEAHKIINEEYGKQFPLRVLSKDIESNDFLLCISEIKDERTKGLFIVRSCLHCGTTFRVIDSYNNTNMSYKGPDYCSNECKTEAYEVKRYIDTGNNDLNGIHQPVIYRVYNHETGLSYIGKTTQAFTLRWYQHFYQSGDTKFHKAIKSTALEDWTFSIIEKIIIPKEMKTKSEIEKYIFERERYWIVKLDCVKNGYNSC